MQEVMRWLHFNAHPRWLTTCPPCFGWGSIVESQRTPEPHFPLPVSPTSLPHGSLSLSVSLSLDTKISIAMFVWKGHIRQRRRASSRTFQRRAGIAPYGTPTSSSQLQPLLVLALPVEPGRGSGGSCLRRRRSCGSRPWRSFSLGFRQEGKRQPSVFLVCLPYFTGWLLRELGGQGGGAKDPNSSRKAFRDFTRLGFHDICKPLRGLDPNVQ